MILSGLNIIKIITVNLPLVAQFATHPLILVMAAFSALFTLAKQNYDARQKAVKLQHEKDLARRQLATQNAQQPNFMNHMLRK